MKYVTLEGRYTTLLFFPLLNHLCYKMLLSFLFFLLTDLESFVEKCLESAAQNPKDSPPLSLHQGLILRLYHFHLVLYPHKPIIVVYIEEVKPLLRPISPRMSSKDPKGKPLWGILKPPSLNHLLKIKMGLWGLLSLMLRLGFVSSNPPLARLTANLQPRKE